MAIEWTQDLAVGFNKIDEQHKELFKRLNNLLEACNQGKGKEEVGNIINFLGAYVVEHFGTEEEFMKKNNYPAFAAHKQQHEEFVKSFTDLKNEFESKGGGILTVLHANKMLVDWLTNHIGKTDKALGAFLNTMSK